MRNIVKIFGLLSIIAVIPGAMAATSRVSVVNKASPRLPSIAGHLVSGTTTTTTTTSSTAAYYGDSECIEKYTDCIKEDDVCGSDFQECTTNVLFHGQMSKCISVLYQCSSSGINALFGTTAINALSNVATDGGKNTEGEIIKYEYPKDGSVLGQLIIGAEITNKLTTEQCVRRYTNCLQRDDICGSDFELCTTNKAFKKQALLCDSTLQRCQAEGKKQLFGSVAYANSLSYAADSRIGTMVSEGNALAALNAVKTCQKVTDNCLISACTKNPLRCVEGISMAEIYTADFVTGSSGLGGATSSTSTIAAGADGQNTYGTGNFFQGDNYLESQTGSNIRKMLKAQCLETIGSNKYCHMTYREKAPSNKELVDIDLQEDVFSLAYAARKDAVNTKVQEAMKKFDTKAKNNCLDTIKSCAMRSCGGGLGSVCYKQAKTNINGSYNNNNGVVINDKPYDDIYAGCSAIVNADANCIYAATTSEVNGTYTYTYYDDSEASAFKTLFPEYGSNNSARDPIGAVATLNSLLATSYNDAAIEKMKKQCESVALSCVKSMCGKDYINCYRNRTDIVISGVGASNTGNASFDRSMNKVGGVLDYNIVIGLCMNTVKNANVCDEHLKIEAVKLQNATRSETWNGSVRNSWLTANETKYDGASSMNGVIVACGPSADSPDECSGSTMEPIAGANGELTCVGVVDTLEDENGGAITCQYKEEITVSNSEYVLKNVASTLFQKLLADEEKNVQAMYNAKLTKEQNICTNNNNGGVKGRSDNGSTFMWVKLRNSKVPNDYQTNGLKANKFVETGDLYGAFCRARITVQSDDKDIQDLLTKNGGSSVAYFAVGDSFTCGSWINDAVLRKISDTVGKRELCKQGYGQWDSKTGTCDGNKLSTKEKIAYAWGTVAPALAGTGIGLGLTESGLLSKAITKGNENNSVSQATIDKWGDSCSESAQKALDAINGKDSSTNINDLNTSVRSANMYAGYVYTACHNMGISESEGCKNLSISCSIKTGKADSDDAEVKNSDRCDKSITSFRGEMQTLKYVCDNYIATGENGRGAKAARIAVPIATTLAGGALGAGITASVIQANRENIKNTAAQQWMDEIGEHIQCYIGTEELGTYGDVVSIELD